MLSLNLQETLSLVIRWIAFATFLQNLELLQLKRYWKNNSVWTSKLIPEKLYLALLILSLLNSVILFYQINSTSVFILLISTYVTAVRWRGSFNGGSDAMTFLVLLSTWIATIYNGHDFVVFACLAYIAFQVCFSFLISGWAKICNPSWRSGKALIRILEHSTYPIPQKLRKFPKDENLFCALSWVLMSFELCFPLAFLHPVSSFAFIFVALSFQIGNWLIFGLNRFFWSWLAAYPAVYFCSRWIWTHS